VEAWQVEALAVRGYREYYVRHALRKCAGDHERALRALQDWGPVALAQAQGQGRGGAAAAGQAAEAQAGAEAEAAGDEPRPAEEAEEGAAGAAGASVPGTPPPPEPADPSAGREGGGGGGGPGSDSDSGDEAERELVGHVDDDPLSAYDLDVREEGELVRELLARIAALEGQ
jgi:hypothetical protein